jgi:hypothetical protein
MRPPRFRNQSLIALSLTDGLSAAAVLVAGKQAVNVEP